jgi:hypothetical protein
MIPIKGNALLSDILLPYMNDLFIHSVLPGKAVRKWYYTNKTDFVEGIGSNSFMSSVKPLFCGLCRRSSHHHQQHIPYTIRLNHLKVACFFPSIHVIQELLSNNLCPFFGNFSPHKMYYLFVLFQVKCAIKSG